MNVIQMFLVDRYGATWKVNNPTSAAIARAFAEGYAVELKRRA